MNRSSRPILLTAVGVLTALAVAGSRAGEGGVLGGSSEGPPVTTQPSVATSHGGGVKVLDDPAVIEHPTEWSAADDTRFRIETRGEEFEVTGVLVSLDGRALVVTAPGGYVKATAAVSTAMRDDLEPGDTVTVRGALRPDGTLLAQEIDLERAVAGGHRSDGTGRWEYQSCSC